jgi:glutathione peroxidase
MVNTLAVFLLSILAVFPLGMSQPCSSVWKKAVVSVGAALSIASPPIVVQAKVGSESLVSQKVSNMGEEVPLGSLLGKKATLIVNVASQCALTPQYNELVSLKDKHKDEGFEILAFPSNQFAGQEPGDVEDIRRNMKAEYNVNFPILDKVDVNGPKAAVFYEAMKSTPGIGSEGGLKKISWNFEKFLIDADGVPVRRYRPGIIPSALETDVNALITKGTLPPRKKATLNDF